MQSTLVNVIIYFLLVNMHHMEMLLGFFFFFFKGEKLKFFIPKRQLNQPKLH